MLTVPLGIALGVSYFWTVELGVFKLLMDVGRLTAKGNVIAVDTPTWRPRRNRPAVRTCETNATDVQGVMKVTIKFPDNQ
jgi:hypothetical protein